MPLGIDSAADYPLGPAAQLAGGDLLFLYTDGIVEASSAGSREQFGIERTLDILRAHREETPDQILGTLYSAASDFSPRGDQSDDITAILVKREADNRAGVVNKLGLPNRDHPEESQGEAE